MKRTAWLILVFLLAHSVFAATMTIPQDAETRENPSTRPYPFSFSGDLRSQQVYSSGFFPTLSLPGQLFQIDSIAFRLASDGSFGFITEATFDRVEVLISSSTGPFTLDLEQNHGLNRQVVYDDALTLSGSVPPGTTPSLFDLNINFTSPFLYNPAAGALVIEIRKYGFDGMPTLGAAEIPGVIFYFQDGPQRPIQTSGNLGLETQISYQVVPEPSAVILGILGFVVVLGLAKRNR
jgi:hypothetical protein